MKLPLINLPQSLAPPDSYERRLNVKLNEILAAMRREINMATAADFGLEVAKGNIAGHYGVKVLGKNVDVDIGSEDVWTQGATWVAPTQARIHSLVSTSTDDDGSPAGLGARTVTVEALDSTYAAFTETVTMDGTTPVAMSTAAIMINHMEVLTAGASGPNVGVITATAATDATVTSAIPAAKGRCQGAIYQVPLGYDAYVTHFAGSIDGVATASVDVEMFVKEFGATFTSHATLQFIGSGTTGRTMDFPVPHVVAEKGIIKAQATSDSNNVDVVARIDLILVKT